MILQPNATQKEKVLYHLKKYGSITTWDCFKRYRITRLSEYIRQLREEDYQIDSNWVREKNKNPYVRYQIKSPSTN